MKMKLFLFVLGAGCMFLSVYAWRLPGAVPEKSTLVYPVEESSATISGAIARPPAFSIRLEREEYVRGEAITVCLRDVDQAVPRGTPLMFGVYERQGDQPYYRGWFKWSNEAKTGKECYELIQLEWSIPFSSNSNDHNRSFYEVVTSGQYFLQATIALREDDDFRFLYSNYLPLTIQEKTSAIEPPPPPLDAATIDKMIAETTREKQMMKDIGASLDGRLYADARVLSPYEAVGGPCGRDVSVSLDPVNSIPARNQPSAAKLFWWHTSFIFFETPLLFFLLLMVYPFIVRYFITTNLRFVSTIPPLGFLLTGAILAITSMSDDLHFGELSLLVHLSLFYFPVFAAFAVLFGFLTPLNKRAKYATASFGLLTVGLLGFWLFLSMVLPRT